VPLNRKIAAVIFDKQTAFGTPAATKRFGLALRGGSVLDPAVTQNYEELTVATRFPPSSYRSGSNPVIDFRSRAWARSSVSLLELALGTRVTTGASDPFTHTITPATNPSYLTAYTRLDTEYHTLSDARIDELSFSWDGREPLEMGVRILGCVLSMFNAGPHTATIDDSGEQSFFPAGGTFQLDTDSGTPATADITGGTITIANHLSPVEASRQITPIDVWPGLHEITVVLRLIPANMTLWRAAVTGSDSGTAVSNAPVYGSFNTKFQIQPTPERSLALSSTRQAWYGPYPEGDPAGGPAEVELTSTVVKPAAGAEFTAIVLNDQAAAIYAGS
jgi:hypothetical protein